MSETKELYDDFWALFIQTYGEPSPLIGSPDKPAHGDNYYDFDLGLGHGFRATAAISLQKDKLGAELSTGRRGKIIVAQLQDNYPSLGNPIEPFIRYFISNSGAKVELIWENADVRNQDIWPVHHLWLKNSLELLAQMFGDKVAE